MNKKNLTIALVILLVLGVVSLALIENNKSAKEEEKTDALRFKEEYSEVSEDNVFVYRDIEEIIDIMENGTGVVYLGFPEYPWCNYYVKYLNEVAKEIGITRIYYYNIYEDRSNNTENYQRIVELLGENLQYDEEGKLRVYVPNVSFHTEGEVIGNDYETSKDTNGFTDPSDYWTEEEISSLKNHLSVYMKEVLGALDSCTECNI